MEKGTKIMENRNKDKIELCDIFFFVIERKRGGAPPVTFWWQRWDRELILTVIITVKQE